MPSSDGVGQVHMEYLESVKFYSPSLFDVASFFEYLTCPKENNITVTTGFCRPPDLDERHAAPLKKLIQKLDDITSGSVLELTAGEKIQCWKSRPERTASSLETPAIEILGLFSYSALKAYILQSLRLDRLVRLELTGFDDDWSILGNFPHVERLKVCHCDERNVIEALSHGVQGSTVKAQPGSDAAFPALKNLTVQGWRLASIWTLDSENKTIAGRLLDCVKLRNGAGLRLERLYIERCIGGVEESDLVNLEEVIDVVDWNESRSDEEEEEEEEEGYSDTDYIYDAL
ncbi:hypothetical protein H0H92_006954 [Tricholoma furcatifolium]|nr:hypothetical protein H0H92_006954 [Tricholoma furcatifolium]